MGDGEASLGESVGRGLGAEGADDPGLRARGGSDGREESAAGSNTWTGEGEAHRAAASHTGVLATAVRVVSGLTLLSRFAGLARDIVTARLFGDTALGSAFRAAYAVPNLFRRLFGEGALSAAFLPEYTMLRRDDPKTADELATLTVRMLTLTTGVLMLVIEVALAVVLVLGTHDAERALSIRLIMLMLPMMPMVCLTAILGGMLQALGRFGPPAAAPIVLNVFQIAAGLAFYFGWTTERNTTAYWVGGAAVVASVVQIAWSLAAMRGKVRWGGAGELARAAKARVHAKFVPAMLGLGTLQVNTMMDVVIAMWPVWVGGTILGVGFPLDKQSHAILSYTQTIYQFPLGVFGIAVATAIFPVLSRCADRVGEFVEVMRRGLRLSLFIGLPASAGLWLVREDLIFTTFSGGEHGFSEEGVGRAAAVLAGFSPAIWAYSLNHVFTRAFYAKGDTTTPMRVAIGSVVLNLVLNWTLIWTLREAGMAYATAIAAVVQCAVLGYLLTRRVGVIVLDSRTLGAFVRITIATAAMGACVWGVWWMWGGAGTWWARVFRLSACCGAGVASFGLIAVVWRLPELRWLRERAPRGARGEVAGMSME